MRCVPLRGLFGLAALIVTLAGSVPARAAGPEQPLPFSHATHVGRRQISCVFCHPYAATSAHATLPSLSTCVDCHRVVRVERPAVQQLLKAYQDRTPIRWVRVTNLPDFVRFTHQRHLKARVACSSCHGDVARMERVEKVHALTMGECLTCHNQRRASTDCFTCHY